ncbi:MAG: mannitol dehydrogenase family protein [Streptococcaceae bacterium]|nr:mannitol dehydrogenase family protein [Streptococcaceae bacterium]
MFCLKKWQDFREQLAEASIELPQFDVDLLKLNGKESPIWLHFGGGNLYRGFHAEVAQSLAQQGALKSGVVVCETFDEEIISKAYQPYQANSLEVVMHEDGSLEKRILAATATGIDCNPNNEKDFSKIIRYFESPTLQFTTFTITEKGYALKDPQGNFFSTVASDIKQGPENASHTMSIVAALLYRRFLAGSLPIAMISTDNFSQNGQRFQDSLTIIATEWAKRDLVPATFPEYLNNPKKVAFPWSMIDRITPNPSKAVCDLLTEVGFEDMEIIHTAKGTNIAPFANTEAVHYLVIEDSFPNGRPQLEKAGVILANRTTVDKADVMKVTTCLNPLHTALAVMGCLLGYTSISAEMQDSDLVALIKEIGYHEGLPVVESPKIIDPKQFIDEVINKRLPNPFIPDAPQRIASDTSQKVAIRFGETIKKYQALPDRNPKDLHFIPLVLAAWLRYLLAIDDNGKPFKPSPDPLLEDLQEKLSAVTLGERNTTIIHQAVVSILSNDIIFGVDLYQAGLGEKVENCLIEMLAGEGAVRATLKIYLEKFGGNRFGNDI